MSFLYDVSLHLNKEGVINRLCWKNSQVKQRYENIWKPYVGTILREIKEFTFNREKDILYWHHNMFRFQSEQIADEEIIFLKRGADREDILQGVLDTLDESIQIYDENGDIIYINRTGREIIGTEENMEGRHLLEVFDVAREDSTTLEAIRMKAPVKNRFRHYYSRHGKELFTVNSAFPVFLEGQLIAVMALEENVSVIARKAEQLEKLQRAIKEQMLDAATRQKESGYTFADLVGHHLRIRELKELALKVSGQESNVLIVGETGTGKEIIAQSIHYSSARKDAPFVALNCAAVPENLIESILFGTAKGAFTGSMDKTGLFEEANQGTLFLDELNSMSLFMQAKVLRALQEKTFRRVGGSKEIKTDIRVISSCNENPFLLMEQKKLRSDLFYRLATIILEIPPLRERVEDIEELIFFHIGQVRGTYVFPFKKIEGEALWQLQQYSWPGNVRELFHAVDYAMNVASDDVFRLKYLPAYCFRQSEAYKKDKNFIPKTGINQGTLQEQVEDFEAELIRRTLKHYFGNVSQTARHLGLKRQGLQYRIRKYGIID